MASRRPAELAVGSHTHVFDFLHRLNQSIVNFFLLVFAPHCLTSLIFFNLPLVKRKSVVVVVVIRLTVFVLAGTVSATLK